MKIYIFILSVVFLASCAPASRYYGIKEDKVPLVSKLDFPINEVIERLIAADGPYQGFPHVIGDSTKENYVQIFYNIPELGELTGVEFYKDPKSKYSWSFEIQYPNVKPSELFKADQVKPVVSKLFEWRVFEVISGPLTGACINDYSLSSTKGLGNSGDRAILIFSKLKNSDESCEDQ
jgi:hypothetical protein